MRGLTLTYAQETFARAFAEGGTLTAAMHEAYPLSRKWKNPTSVTSQGIKTLKNPLVRAKVRELRGERAEAHMWSAARVVLALAQSAAEAREARQYGPAVRAYELIGKHLGMFGAADLAAPTVNVAVSTAVQQLDVDTLRALAARYDALEAAPSAPLMLGDAVYMDGEAVADAPIAGEPEA